MKITEKTIVDTIEITTDEEKQLLEGLVKLLDTIEKDGKLNCGYEELLGFFVLDLIKYEKIERNDYID